MKQDFPEAWEIARTAPSVRRTLNGATRQAGGPKRQRDPITVSMIREIVALASRPTASYDDRLFGTIAALAFHNAHRLGELVRPDAGTNWRKTIKRASVDVGGAAEAAAFSYSLPFHKGDRLYRGTSCAVVASRDPSIDPARLLRRYVADRDARFGQLAPYLFMRENGDVPSRRWFLSKLTAFRFPGNIGGHSFRAGGATHYATLGFAPEWIKRLGRWSSVAFEDYLRRHPAVMAVLREHERLAALGL
jgi:hypothetical protein